MASLFRLLPIKNFSNIIKRNKSKSQPACKKKQKVQNHIIVRPTPDDFECIIELMHKAYYREEPTTSSVGFKPTPFFDDRTLQTLTQGYSLVAKCKYNGDILGAAINDANTCWDAEVMDSLACKVCDAKSRKLLHFYAYIHRFPDLYRKYKVDKIFEESILFVRKNDRNKGIAFHLSQESRKLAGDCGYGIFRIDATSHFTAKLAEKMKMKMVGEIPYCSYVGVDKRPIFNPPAPHHSVKIYIDEDPKQYCAQQK